MKQLVKWTAWALLIACLLAAMLSAAVVWGWQHDVWGLRDVTVSIDGQPVDVSALKQLDAVAAGVVALGAGAAVVVCMGVGLLFGVAGLLIGLLVMVVAVFLAGSPLLLAALVAYAIWRLAIEPKPSDTAAHGVQL
jgi:phage shock protein PspC (stress-responsive transcriptional regulator)